MDVLPSVVAAAALFTLLRAASAWFRTLDAECACATASATLEDPASLKKIPAPSLWDDPTRSLTVVVPAYNEEERLPRALDELLSYLDRRRDRTGPSFTYEVVIVDDGSADGTARVAFSYSRARGADAVRVLRLPRNRGKGAAVRAGAFVARGERVLMMDADGATRVADLDRLDAALTELADAAAKSAAGAPPLGAALGSRAHLAAGVSATRSAHRNFLMKGFHALVVAVAGPAIADTQCGFKLFTRRAARLLFGNQRLQRWCFDVELVYLASRLSVPLVEVAVNWAEVPGSKIRITSILHMALELAAIAAGYGSGVWRAAGEGELARVRVAAG